MSDGLEINTSFFANRGTIGRRDFALNMMYLGIIVTALSIPFSTWAPLHAKNITDLIYINKFVFSAPFFHIVLLMLAMAFSVVIGISNIKRRITDIAGKENNVSKYIICGLWFLASLWMFMPLHVFAFVNSLCLFVLLFLYFKKGQITSALPYDVTKDFNFAAFWGSALWGLANKVYQPLWMLILMFTPFSGIFAMICGLKGNEWYFKKQSKDVKIFKKEQKRQAIIMFIACFIILPFVVFFIMTALSVFTFNMAVQSPEFEKFGNNNVIKMEKMAAELEQLLIEKYFVNYKIYGTRNEFYINDDAWNSTPFEDKMKLLGLAAQIAADKRNGNAANPSIKTTKGEELQKTKFYSATTKELIGEYSPDISKNQNDLAGLKAHMLGYKFSNVTK